MTTLYFTREFTKGTLKGLHHLGRISFPSAEDCLQWVAAVNRKNRAGRCDYRIVDKSFQNYAR